MGFDGINWGTLPPSTGSGSNTSTSSNYSYKPYVPGSRDFGFEVPYAFPGDRADREVAPDIYQVDVRSRNMRALEEASLPLLLQTLLNPQSIGQQFGSAAGSVPQPPVSGLASFLFGGQASPYAPPAGGGQQPPAGGGGQQPPQGYQPPNYGPGTIPPPMDPRTGQPQQPGGAPVFTDRSGQPTQRQPGDGSPDPYTQTNSLQQQILAFAESLAPTQARAGYNWQQPLMGTSGLLDTYLNSLRGGLAGNDAFMGNSPSVGTGATALGLLLQGLPAGFGSTAGLPVGAETPMSLATQLWGILPPEARAQAIQGKASAAQFGGDTGPLMPFLQSIGFNMNDPRYMSNYPGTNTPVTFRAMGGPLDPNAINIVGEAGPEAIVGNQVMPLAGGPQLMNASMLPPQQPASGTPTTPAPGGFATSPNQGPGTGSIQRLLEQNPEMQAFGEARGILGQQGGILGQGGAGQGILQALQPVFQQNLRFGLNELTNRVPSVNNSGAAIEGANLTSRALNDYNLLAAQALQQGQQNTLGGLGILGQLAGQAGNGAFGRQMQAGQLATQRDLGYGNLALQAQQQQYNQSVNPTLQLLLAALGMATPTAYQTVVKS